MLVLQDHGVKYCRLVPLPNKDVIEGMKNVEVKEPRIDKCVIIV